MSNVYVMGEDGCTTAMERLRCENEDKELQRVLELNADLLPGDQINPEEPRRWLLIKREMPVPDPASGSDRWSIDFVFGDQDAIPTFVECKRFADTRSRREVVGQMLEYGANGYYYWDAETLRRAAEETARAASRELDACIAELLAAGEEEADGYFSRMEENLREGQLRLVFFMEESPMELRSIVEFLNRQMERAEVLLVEAKQYRHGETRIVVPTLFGFTEAARQVKRTVTVSRRGARRSWNKESFFEDLHRRLAPEQAHAVERLFDLCVDELKCDVSWGTGAKNGSFNVREPTVCPRSFVSCYTSGELWWSFHWWEEDSDKEARENLRQLLRERVGLAVPDGEVSCGIKIEDWLLKLDDLCAAIREFIEQCRRDHPA